MELPVISRAPRVCMFAVLSVCWCYSLAGWWVEMARSRPIEPSTFVLVLGVLLAHQGSIDAFSAYQYRHNPGKPSLGWLPHRSTTADNGPSAELVPFESDRAQAHDGVPSLGIKVAAALRGGILMRQSSKGDEEKENEETGDAVTAEGSDEEPEDEEEAVLYDEKAVEWMMQQLCMYQTRTALISKPLAAKVL